MDRINKIVFILFALVVIVFSLFYVSSSLNIDPLTGYVTVESGRSNELDVQRRPNPRTGILKGTVEYTIEDNSVVIDTEPAFNTSVYFVGEGNQPANYSLIKLSDEDSDYRGTINNIDADGQDSQCSSRQYETYVNYYDTDNDNDEDSGEFLVYSITTDQDGCYAIKLPIGSYDIYI